MVSLIHSIHGRSGIGALQLICFLGIVCSSGRGPVLLTFAQRGCAVNKKVQTFRCVNLGVVMTIEEFVDQVGARVIAFRLDVNEQNVRKAVIAGRFPARWYAGLQEIAAERALACPLALFHMRPLRAPATKDAAA